MFDGTTEGGGWKLLVVAFGLRGRKKEKNW